MSQGLLLGLEPHDRRHRPERLLAARSSMSRLTPVSSVGSKNVPPERVPRPARDAPTRRAATASAMCRCTFATASVADQRPLLDAGVEPRCRRRALDRLAEALHELVVDTGLHQHAVRAHTGLPSVAELRGHRARDGRVHVGVVEDDQRRVATELQGDLLQRPRALRHQQLADGGRAGEAQLAHAGVGGEQLRRSSRAGRDDVEAHRRGCPARRANSASAVRGQRRLARPA